jgi:hypothetical protein
MDPLLNTAELATPIDARSDACSAAAAPRPGPRPAPGDSGGLGCVLEDPPHPLARSRPISKAAGNLSLAAFARATGLTLRWGFARPVDCSVDGEAPER